MTRIRPMGQCEECDPAEGQKEIIGHGLCAKHNQRRLRAIWRKPEPNETQKQRLMEKLEKDLISIKNMCAKWERDGYVATKLITAETVETFRTELDDYMDFRPTLKSAEPKTEIEEALAGYKAPPPMFEDEDPETTSKKADPSQYQFAPVPPRMGETMPTLSAGGASKQAKRAPKAEAKETKTNGTPKACKEAGWTFKKRGDSTNVFEITGVDYTKRELKVVGSDTPVSFVDVLFLTDPERPDKNLTSYFATGDAEKNEVLANLDRVKGIGKPPQPSPATEAKKSTKKGRING